MHSSLATKQNKRVNPTLETLMNAKNSFELYDAEIEEFFQQNYIYHGVLHRRDRFASISSFGRKAVIYIHRGRIKNYITNPNGQEVFLGFLPQYSTITTLRSGNDLGKSMVANTDCSFYVSTSDSYFKFLASSPKLIEHQILEPYYRRNLNDLPKNETMFYPAQIKVYEYVLYLAILFSTPKPEGDPSTTVNFPPSVKDTASYLGIHRSNASRFFSELEEQGFIDHSTKSIRVHNIFELSKKIEQLKQSHVTK